MAPQPEVPVRLEGGPDFPVSLRRISLRLLRQPVGKRGGVFVVPNLRPVGPVAPPVVRPAFGVNPPVGATARPRS